METKNETKRKKRVFAFVDNIQMGLYFVANRKIYMDYGWSWNKKNCVAAIYMCSFVVNEPR